MLKEIYWFLESVIYESYARIMRVKRSFIQHQLDANLIVSLTSYPPRFDKLHLTIKTILNQSVRPNKIILWIAYLDLDKLPSQITNLTQEHEDFIIQCCEDLRSFKKLVPTLINYSDAYIVIGDDDVYYPFDWLKNLVKNYSGRNEIIANRAHKVRYTDEDILPYETWDKNYKSTTDEVLMATGIGGVLYPPNCFSKDVLDQSKFMNLCSTADDVWFFWMSRVNGYNTVTTSESINIVNWLGSHETGLAQVNVSESGNNVCIQNLIKHFGFKHIHQTFRRREIHNLGASDK